MPEFNIRNIKLGDFLKQFFSDGQKIRLRGLFDDFIYEGTVKAFYDYARKSEDNTSGAVYVDGILGLSDGVIVIFVCDHER